MKVCDFCKKAKVKEHEKLGESTWFISWYFTGDYDRNLEGFDAWEDKVVVCNKCGWEIGNLIDKRLNKISLPREKAIKRAKLPFYKRIFV